MVVNPEDAECFLSARDGDNLTTPFQYDVCHFVNIMGREPLVVSAQDLRLLKCIRCATSMPFGHGSQVQ
jgi:hypothetical protein